jgi:hypothetical protein
MYVSPLGLHTNQLDADHFYRLSDVASMHLVNHVTQAESAVVSWKDCNAAPRIFPGSYFCQKVC